jgi:hypothetical protein
MASDLGKPDAPQQPNLMPSEAPPASPPQQGWPPSPQQGPVPGRLPKRRPGRRVILEVVGGIVVLFIGVAIGSAGSKAGGNTPVAASAPPAQAATASASASPTPAEPSPNGTYQGSCNYTLGSDPVNGTAVATGDVQVTNTGNIGTITQVKITWPQQGYAPLAMSKTVRLAAGENQDVQFHMPLTSDQLDNLQNWQSGHSFQDGCTYNATITGTFGQAQ